MDSMRPGRLDQSQPSARPDVQADVHPDVHLDEVAAMRLADGEPVDARLTGHAARCPLCAALISTFRDEAVVLSASVSLDETELSALLRAQVPARVASLVSGPAAVPFPDVQRDTPASLLAMLITATVGYFAWLLAQPTLEAGLDIVRRSGALTIAAQYLANWAFALMWTFWDVFQAVESLRLLEAPALPLFFLAFLAWLAIWLVPHPASVARVAPSA